MCFVVFFGLGWGCQVMGKFFGFELFEKCQGWYWGLGVFLEVQWQEEWIDGKGGFWEDVCG